MDYGIVDLVLVGEYSQIDLFGSTLNLCSKINTSSLSIPNTLIIGKNFYTILKSFSTIMDNYDFINNGEYNITEYNRYSTYSIKRKIKVKLNDIEISSNENSFNGNKHLSSFAKYQLKRNNNKRVILVDDEEDLLFTYNLFLEDDYNVTTFTDP